MNRVFSSVQLDESGTVAGLRGNLQTAIGQGAKGLLLLIGSGNKIDLKQLPNLLRELAVPAVGVVVPGVLLQDQVYEDGIAVCGLTSTSAATVVPNINRSKQELNHDIQQILSLNPNPSGVLIVIDGLSRGVDNFSDINESLGYQIGDAVLGAISKRIVLADEKLAATARLDGDEFGFLITDLPAEESAASERVVTLTRWLLLQIEQPCELDDRTVSVAASAGITVFKADAEQPQAVLSHGRSALRRAKSLGRNTIHLHDTSLDEETSQRLSLDYDMRSALKSGDFQLWLQPQVDQQGRIIGAETLIRWNHADKGLLLPNSFIPMAEKSGFIVPLSEWVLNEACRLIKLLNEQAVWPAGAKLGVNLSAKQFHQPDFVNRVLTTIKERNVSAEQIELELTERTLLDNVEEA
ncbi:MAG: EAL domain-containing protein, partial [Candidatus Thiodiazotropha endolucinida]|nr:EAL domain-containing protein [Candidatus Thiodiazotropha taylori]MCW4313049.1 EAL domain-containing protein [Candidatus Thiodiazotropha taylori]